MSSKGRTIVRTITGGKPNHTARAITLHQAFSKDSRNLTDSRTERQKAMLNLARQIAGRNANGE